MGQCFGKAEFKAFLRAVSEDNHLRKRKTTYGIFQGVFVAYIPRSPVYVSHHAAGEQAPNTCAGGGVPPTRYIGELCRLMIWDLNTFRSLSLPKPSSLM